MTTDVIGTCNIKVTLSDSEAEAVLDRVLREGAPELLAIQEWDAGPPDLNSHWRFIRPANAPGPIGPFVYNSSRYTMLSCEPKQLAGEEFVGDLPGRKSTLPPSVAALGVFVDEVLGGEVACINIHLTAEVQDRHGSYHRDKAHHKRVKRHKRERRKVAALVRRQRRKRRRVFVCGDTNFDGFVLPPLVSCWKDRKGGTLGFRAVDVVLAPQRAKSVRTIPTKSDHHAVVVEYERENT